MLTGAFYISCENDKKIYYSTPGSHPFFPFAQSQFVLTSMMHEMIASHDRNAPHVPERHPNAQQ
jgi:hypothetical protein